MLDEEKIRQIAQEVAIANLSGTHVISTSSTGGIDSEGREALRITIVLEPGAALKITVMPRSTPSFKCRIGCAKRVKNASPS